MSNLKYCEKCHSQLDETGNHYYLTECVANKIKELEQQLSNSISKVDVFSMIKACEDLKQDLLERADEDAKGIKIVGVSHSKWLQFKRELSKLNKLIEGNNNG